MKTTIYKYCFIVMIMMAAKGLAAQTTSVPFKEINKSGATDNFTIREIKKKELEIVPSKIVTLNQPGATPVKKSSKKKTRN
jgi:hypothetical protein